MTMKLVGTSTKSSKYWVGKCPCAHPVPTALQWYVILEVEDFSSLKEIINFYYQHASIQWFLVARTTTCIQTKGDLRFPIFVLNILVSQGAAKLHAISLKIPYSRH